MLRNIKKNPLPCFRVFFSVGRSKSVQKTQTLVSNEIKRALRMLFNYTSLPYIVLALKSVVTNLRNTT